MHQCSLEERADVPFRALPQLHASLLAVLQKEVDAGVRQVVHLRTDVKAHHEAILRLAPHELSLATASQGGIQLKFNQCGFSHFDCVKEGLVRYSKLHRDVQEPVQQLVPVFVSERSNPLSIDLLPFCVDRACPHFAQDVFEKVK